MKKIEKFEIKGAIEKIKLLEATQDALNDIYDIKIKINEIIEALSSPSEGKK